jgi:transcription factor MYB, plant
MGSSYGRMDNEIKNYRNTHLRKKLVNLSIAHQHSFHLQLSAPPPPRCPDLNLDLCISPPSPFQDEEREEEEVSLIKQVVVKRELLQL